MSNAFIEHDDRTVVALTGDVDLEHSPAIRTMVLRGVDRKLPVIVDLSNVDYIDSSGIAILIEGYKTAQEKKLTFELVAQPGQVMRVLELARLEKVFTIRESRDGALTD